MLYIFVIVKHGKGKEKMFEFGGYEYPKGSTYKYFRNKRIEVDVDTIFAAFRYALGRKSYIVSTVVDDIVENWSLIPNKDKDLIIKEIKESIDKDCAGMQCDIEQWKRVLELEHDSSILSSKSGRDYQ